MLHIRNFLWLTIPYWNWCQTQFFYFIIIWAVIPKYHKWVVRSKLIWEATLKTVYVNPISKQANTFPWAIGTNVLHFYWTKSLILPCGSKSIEELIFSKGVIRQNWPFRSFSFCTLIFWHKLSPAQYYFFSKLNVWKTFTGSENSDHWPRKILTTWLHQSHVRIRLDF